MLATLVVSSIWSGLNFSPPNRDLSIYLSTTCKMLTIHYLYTEPTKIWSIALRTKNIDNCGWKCRQQDRLFSQINIHLDSEQVQFYAVWHTVGYTVPKIKINNICNFITFFKIIYKLFKIMWFYSIYLLILGTLDGSVCYIVVMYTLRQFFKQQS